MSQIEIFQRDNHFPMDHLEYYPGFFGRTESAMLMAALTGAIQWKQETLLIYGRQVKTPRLTAWYGDEGVAYTYSGRQFFGLPWTKELLDIKTRMEPFAQTRFNSVLLNYYR